jgi:hypothetical protein
VDHVDREAVERLHAHVLVVIGLRHVFRLLPEADDPYALPTGQGSAVERDRSHARRRRQDEDGLVVRRLVDELGIGDALRDGDPTAAAEVARRAEADLEGRLPRYTVCRREDDVRRNEGAGAIGRAGVDADHGGITGIERPTDDRLGDTEREVLLGRRTAPGERDNPRARDAPRRRRDKYSSRIPKTRGSCPHDSSLDS